MSNGNILNRIFEPRQQIATERKRFGNRALFALILPIVIEQFLALLVGIADTFMISYAGETAVSGVALVTQLDNVFIVIFSAMATGGSVIISQYVGIRDKEMGSRAASQLLMIISLIAVTIAALIFILGDHLFTLLFGGAEQGVYDAGVLYLKICASSFLFLGIYNACAGAYRSMGDTRSVMRVAIVMNIINIGGNAIGVFLLHAGVAGVAVPSLIARIFAAVVMLTKVTRPDSFIRIRLREVFHWNGAMIRRIFRIAIPGSVENGLFMLAKLVISSEVATFGTAQIAAYGVSQSFWSMSALFCLAMGPAFITVIGQYMGAGDVEGAEYYMKKLLRITFVGAIAWNAFFYGVMSLMLMGYNLSSEAAHYVMILVLIHNVFNGLFCPISFALSNGLRASGDAKYSMYATVASSVVIRTALSLFLGMTLHLGVVGVAMAMVCDWLSKAIFIWIRYRSGKWKNFKVI